jgi:hypothetical protein
MACEPSTSPEERKAKEDKIVSFCKTVVDAITPDDKTCGPYFDRVKHEVAAEQAEVLAREKADREAASTPRPPVFRPWGAKVNWRWGEQGPGPGCIGDNTCFRVEVKPILGCKSLYVAAALINAQDQNIGFANDITQEVAAGEVAVLTLSTSEDINFMRISEINCF